MICRGVWQAVVQLQIRSFVRDGSCSVSHLPSLKRRPLGMLMAHTQCWWSARRFSLCTLSFWDASSNQVHVEYMSVWQNVATRSVYF